MNIERNPLKGIPRPVRMWAYNVYMIGSAVVPYLAVKGYVGASEVALWSSLGVLVGATAASNITPEG